MSRIEANPGTQVADVAPAASAGGTDVKVNADGTPRKPRGASSKIDYPGIEGGRKLTEYPADFDPHKHKTLGEEHFDESKLDVFYDHKAAEAQSKADNWRTKSQNFKRFGGIADKKTAQKVSDSLATMRKSLETLAAQGVDLSTFDAAILAACGIELPAKV